MAKTTTKTVRFIYDAKGRVKERIEETVTTETPDALPPATWVQPYWDVTPLYPGMPQIWCDTNTSTTGVAIRARQVSN